MRTLGWIAMNGFRESVRDKVLYNLVAFAILLMGTSYLLGQLTAGQDLKIMKDLGLSAMAVFGLFMAVFIGIGLVSKEVERRSIYNLMAKPIRRHQIVLGDVQRGHRGLPCLRRERRDSGHAADGRPAQRHVQAVVGDFGRGQPG